MRQSFGAALARLLRRLVPLRLTNRYRPERHYMRGPGPKSRGREPGVDSKAMAASLGNAGKSPGA
ncbi:MAG: hypothetical protein Q7T45_17935 [Bradyrhizobium sp.]|uniref:hypothetical protein n=1 Tax=Bradyrhizobium sp. TaxID=376 RepID=UPI00272669C2|nr:hypothetical protein [Bradyrhizobium sp.]MDO8399697.1 hypothetical protein [Bradyrhizobium sp.]